MLKKSLLSGLALATLASASASQCASVTGFYAGLNAGLANTNVDYKVNSKTDDLGTKIDSGKSSAFGGLFAGYGTLFSGCGYVGAEASFGFDATKVTAFDTATAATKTLTAKLSRKNYYGLAVRLGALVTPQTLAYVKLGVEGGKWELKSENNESAYTGNEKLVKKSKSGVNLVAGAGMETYITKNMFIGAEYSYLRGPTINIENKSDGATFTTISTKAKVGQHRVGLRVGYKF
jgi:opacity protein-like surface antigen